MGTQKRSYGSGSIRFKDASFHFTIRLNGKKKTFLLRAKNQQDAEREADSILRRFEFMNELETKEQLAAFVGKAKNLILDSCHKGFEDGFDVYRKSKPECGESFLRVKRYVWDLFAEFCRERNLSDPCQIEVDNLVQFRNLLRKTRSPKTCNEYMRAILQFLKALGIPTDRFRAFRP